MMLMIEHLHYSYLPNNQKTCHTQGLAGQIFENRVMPKQTLKLELKNQRVGDGLRKLEKAMHEQK